MNKVNLRQYAGDLRATELVVKASDYDEGLAREEHLSLWKAQAEDGWKQANRVIEMQREKLDKDEAQIETLQRRLAEAEKLLDRAEKLLRWNKDYAPSIAECCAVGFGIVAFLASPGCADGEKSND